VLDDPGAAVCELAVSEYVSLAELAALFATNTFPLEEEDTVANSCRVTPSEAK
jgi:hypothetical protein